MSMGIGIGISPVLCGGVWSPLNLGSALIAWHDAQNSGNFTLNGSNVAQWDDLSGNGNHLLQATAADQPLYDSTNKRVTFDGVSEYLQSAAYSSALSQPNTIFIVGSRSSTDAGQEHFTDGLTAITRHVIYSTDTWKLWAGATLSGPSKDTNNHIFTGEFNGASSNLYIGGGTPTTGDAGTNTLDGLSLGAEGFTPNNHLDGYVKEAMVISKLLPTVEKNQIGNYLKGKHSGTSWTDTA